MKLRISARPGRALAVIAFWLALLLSACVAPPASPPSQSPVASPAPAQSAASPAAAPVSGEITVFAAASLTDVFTEAGDRFKALNPGATVTFNFGASTQLVAQLDQGASADVFASADQAQMDRAKSAGRIGGADQVFATNRLVVIAPASNPGAISGPGDLAKPGLRVVTTQADVPIGVYTQTMLDGMSQSRRFGSGFKDQVNANVVSREPNVRQIVAKVQLGEADAGVVYKSDVTPQAAPQLTTFDVPDEFNTIASYPIARVKDAPNAAGADAFVAFVLSPAGQQILGKWNFLPRPAG